MKKIKLLILPCLLLTSLLILPSCDDNDSEENEEYFEIKDQSIRLDGTTIRGEIIYDFPDFKSIESTIEFKITEEEILELLDEQDDNITAYMEIGIDRANSTMVIPGTQYVYIRYTGVFQNNKITFTSYGYVNYYDGEEYVDESIIIFNEGCAINHEQLFEDADSDLTGSGHFYFNYSIR